jgi:hypothetical protein
MFKPPVLFLIVGPDSKNLAVQDGFYQEALDPDGYPQFVLHTNQKEAEEALRKIQNTPKEELDSYSSEIDFSEFRVIRYEPIVDAVPEK